MLKLLLILVVIIRFVYAFVKLANRCFDDDDADMYWHDNYAVVKCPHLGEKTDVVVNSNINVEEIWTCCDSCGDVVNKRVET